MEQARFDELLLRELPALNPTPQPTQSSLFTGTWECQWTDEKELNFAVANGLFRASHRRRLTLTNTNPNQVSTLTLTRSLRPAMAAHLPGAAPPESLEAHPDPSRSRSPSPKPNPSLNPSADPEPCPSPDLAPNPN